MSPATAEQHMLGLIRHTSITVPQHEHVQIRCLCGCDQTWRLQDLPPLARRGDPDTSRAAAASVRNQSGLHVRILWLVGLGEPVTDEMILQLVRAYFADQKVSPSGIRSRRSELVRMGKVRRAKLDGETEAGRRCARWELAP